MRKTHREDKNKKRKEQMKKEHGKKEKDIKIEGRR